MATDRLFNQTQGESLISAVTALQSKGFTAAQITTLLSTFSGTNTALDSIRAAIASTSRGSVVSVTPAQSSGQAVGTVRVDNVDFPLFSLPTVARTQTALTSIADILAGQDAEKTATGNPVTITAKAAPVRALSVEIEPVQAGSGTPSMSNVRPITGWNAVTVTRTGEAGANPLSVTISTGEAGTVYGGTLDVLSGKLAVTHKCVDVSTLAVRNYGDTGNVAFTAADMKQGFRHAGMFSHGRVSRDSGTPTDGDVWLGVGNNSIYWIGAKTLAGVESLSDFSTWLRSAGVQAYYPLATPLTYTLTPAQLSTLAGTNAITADCGPLTVRYIADLSSEIADLRAKINALGGA